LKLIGDAEMTTRVITAHVPGPLAKKVDEMATSLERSRGWIVKEALVAWVAQEEERLQWTLDALADVEAGRVVDHEAVSAWAASLESATPLPLPVATRAPTKSRRPAHKSRKR
jgi:predicted transcriptional regulator